MSRHDDFDRSASETQGEPPWTLTPVPPPVLGGRLYHPFSEAFRLLEGAELDAIIASLKNHHSVVVVIYQGMILDGRNRYRACLKAGVEPQWLRFDGDDVAAREFVRVQNMLRRHDNEYERAKAARALMTTTWGGDRRSAGIKLSNDDLNQKEAAAACGTTVTAMARVGRIEKAHLMIQRAAEMEIVTISKADTLARKSEEDQQVEVDKWIADAVRHKGYTPEQRERWAQRRKLAPKPKREIDPKRQSKLMTAIKLASWEIREFAFKALWEMFGPATRARLIEEVIAPGQAEQYGFGGEDMNPAYEGDDTEARG